MRWHCFHVASSQDILLERHAAVLAVKEQVGSALPAGVSGFAVGDRVTADVRDAESAWEAASQRVAVARELVDTARKVEEGERTRYELGDSNLIFVNQREVATADAEAALVEAVAAAHRARVDLTWAMGALGEP